MVSNTNHELGFEELSCFYCFIGPTALNDLSFVNKQESVNMVIYCLTVLNGVLV